MKRYAVLPALALAGAMTLPAPQAKAFDPVTAAIVGGLAIGTIGAAAATNATVHPGWGYAYAPAPAYVPATRAYAYEPAPVWRTRRVVRTHVAPRRVYVAPRRRVVSRGFAYEPAPAWRTRRVVRTHVAPHRMYAAPRRVERRVVTRDAAAFDYPNRRGPSYGPTVNVGFGFGTAHPGWW